MGSATNHTIGEYSVSGIYLRMDGQGIQYFLPDGGGTVNCQVWKDGVPAEGVWERFNFEKQSDGSYAIGSVTFPGVYLRMDGSGVSQSTPIGGIVNCQFGILEWEKFNIAVVPVTMGMSIESAAFPGVYLRMDDVGCTENTAPGCGKINCHWGVNREAPIREAFYILPLPQGDNK
jgi:phospholipase C